MTTLRLFGGAAVEARTNQVVDGSRNNRTRPVAEEPARAGSGGRMTGDRGSMGTGAEDEVMQDEGGSDESVGQAEQEGPRRRYGPLESIAIKPRLFALPIIVLVTIALVAAFLRPPVYSAESQLIVGSVVRDFQSADGQILAIQQLTDIYSRLVGSSAHMAKVEAAMGESVPDTALTAAPIPNSALIRLDATGSSQDEAAARADAGAEQLVAYVDQLRSEASSNAQVLEDQITAASVEVDAASTAQASASAAVAAATAAGLPAAQQALQQAQAALTTANLKLDTLQTNYRQIQQSNSGGIGVTVFAPAQPTGSDRKSNLQLYGIGALLLGGLLGMALATLSANSWQLIPRSEETEIAP